MASGGSIKRRKLSAVLAVLVCAGAVVATQSVTTPAWAASTVTLRVVIEHVDEDGCTDSTSGSDFYARIVIAGQAFNFGPIDGEDVISPNWTAQKVLDVDVASSASVVITLAESDGFLNFGDDECDIAPNGGTDLDLTVTLIPCSVAGDASGLCAMPINTNGNGEEDGNAELRFRVEVDVPAATPGLAVRCTHSPLWPQPGDNVTITIESLDGTVQVGDTMVDLSFGPPGPPLVDHKKIADDLEIWVTDPAGPDLDVANKSTDSFVVNAVPAGDLVYGCVVKEDADIVFTGWRRTRVGPPAQGTAIPVSFTGARANRVDVVFIADTDSYTAANDPAFLSDAADVIKGAYYGQDYFLANQQRINFWLADQVGDADRVAAPTPTDPANTNCVLTPPANWATDYSWRDAGAILHADTFRDCASSGLFSTEPTSLGTALHETGHAPFGLADEYCCDGGYFENPPNPNMFDTLAECQADAPTLGRVAADCRTVTDTRPTPPKDWFLSEPTPNDLMNADQRPPQAADIRRMDWFFGNCDAGKC
jgi:hypothetical protein